MRGNKMFEWKVEDMRLREEAINENLKWSSYEVFKNTYKAPYIFKCENAISKEEKIKFVDEMTNGKLSYIINLVNKFDNEKETLPKDSYGEVKTVSLKAWLKRNDSEQVIDNYFECGLIRFFGDTTRIQHFDNIGKYIDRIFHHQLAVCLNEEMKYFVTHDEYSVLTNQLKSQIGEVYGCKYSVYLDKRNIVQVVKSYEGFSLCTYDKNGTQRKLSLEELKEVKQDFDEIDAFMETLAQKRQKSYEHDNLNTKHKKQEDFSR